MFLEKQARRTQRPTLLRSRCLKPWSISVRYARDFRSDLDTLKRVLVPTPTGAQVPISLLADIAYRTGPPSIREENAQLVGYVFVDITSSDIDGYVRAASQEISQKVHFPQGANVFEQIGRARGGREFPGFCHLITVLSKSQVSTALSTTATAGAARWPGL